MSKSEKIPSLSSDHKEALSALRARPEFKALEKLFLIQENNIIIESFSVNSSDPQLAIKKGWYEGRLWELRKILKTFQDLKTDE